jgi:ornithine cyclodeaminase/alanine dehydrogenase-like protein (mu-crystallin family)
MVHTFTEDDVAAGVSMPAAVDAVRRSFARLADGHIHHGPRIQLPTSNGYFATMSVSDRALGLAGVKSYSAIDTALSGFSLVVNRMSDGRTRGVIEADFLTRTRTGAASGVAAGCLARQPAQTVGIIGCGRQAPAQLEGVRCAVPGLRAVAWSPRKQQLREFCAQTGAVAADSAAEVAGCDIVIASTTSRTPVIEGRWLREGALVIAIGGGGHGDRELDDEVLSRSGLITCDSLASSQAEAADLREPARAGLISWEAVVELGDVITGRHPGRRDEREIIVFKSNGLGAWDLAVAALLLDKPGSNAGGADVAAPHVP